MDQLVLEQRERGKGLLAADVVIAKLTEAGVSLPAAKQELAVVQRARYCVGGTTRKGLALSVCEYPSEEDARVGREHSLTSFKAIPHREILVRGNTTLTLRGSAAPPLESDEGKRAAEAYRELPLPQQ